MHEEDLYLKNTDKLLKNYSIYLVVLKAYSKSTREIYYDAADSFLFFLNKKKYCNINQVTKKTFLEFISYVRNNTNIGNRTTNLLISSLNNFAKFLCEKYKYCGLQKLNHLRFMSKIPNIIDESEMLRLLKIKNPIHDKKATWLQYRNYALAVFIYSSGLRISEAMNILLGDFIGDGWVRVECGKGKKTRVAPVNIHVLIAINNYRDQCPYSVFKTLWFCRKGNPLKSGAASKSIKNTFGFTAHYFRHAFATHLILNGCDLMVVKEFLGHSSIHTTGIYVHVKPKHLAEAIKKHPMANNEL